MLKDFTWPSHTDRAKHPELERVCKALEQAVKESSKSDLNAETALCIWENHIELKCNTFLKSYQDSRGTSETRLFVITTLAPMFDKSWSEQTKERDVCYTFDWEYTPLLMVFLKESNIEAENITQGLVDTLSEQAIQQLTPKSETESVTQE